MPTWTLELRSIDESKDVHVAARGIVVNATDVDSARKEAKRLLAQKGFAKVRALNFAEGNHIIAYLPGPQHAVEYSPRKDAVGLNAAPAESTSTVKHGGQVVKTTTVWKKPPGPRRPDKK